MREPIRRVPPAGVLWLTAARGDRDDSTASSLGASARHLAPDQAQELHRRSPRRTRRRASRRRSKRALDRSSKRAARSSAPRKGRIALADRLGCVSGRVQAGRGGRAVVITDDGDPPIALSTGALRPAMHGDRVLVEVDPYTPARAAQRPRPQSPRARPRRAGRRAACERRRRGASCRAIRASEPSRESSTRRCCRREHWLRPRSSSIRPPTRTARCESPSRLGARRHAADRDRGGRADTLGIPTEFPADVEAEADACLRARGPSPSAHADLRSLLTSRSIRPTRATTTTRCSIERARRRLSPDRVDRRRLALRARPAGALDAEALERGNQRLLSRPLRADAARRALGDVASLEPDVDRLTMSVIARLRPRRDA